MRALLFGLAALAGAAQACDLPGGEARKIQSARYEVLYRTLPAPLKVGEHFALEFAVCPAPESVRVDAWMPEHRHGMNYRATVTAAGKGRYKAEGLMLHMAGNWELVFELRSKDSVERVVQVIRLE
jgi:YtkA-like protein